MTRVVVIGNATVDIIQRVERFPLPGETLLCDAMVVCAGGKGLNQAIASARTGTPTLLRAPASADANGDLLARAVAAEAGLDADWLATAPPTDISTIWIDADGENVIVSSVAAAAAMEPAHAIAACAALGDGDVLLVQGNLSEATTAAAIGRAQANGARIVLNTAPMRPWMGSLLAAVDVVVANALEAAQLAGNASDSEAALLVAGAGAVVVSRGRGGAVLATDRGRWVVAAMAVAAVDTAGAGDVMTGTLAGLLAQGVGIAAALEVAVAAASLSVTRSGTTASFPSRAEIAGLRATPANGAQKRCRA
jgi:ribokinase